MALVTRVLTFGAAVGGIAACLVAAGCNSKSESRFYSGFDLVKAVRQHFGASVRDVDGGSWKGAGTPSSAQHATFRIAEMDKDKSGLAELANGLEEQIVRSGGRVRTIDAPDGKGTAEADSCHIVYTSNGKSGVVVLRLLRPHGQSELAYLSVEAIEFK